MQGFERLTGVRWEDYDEKKHRGPQTRHTMELRQRIVNEFQARRLFRRINKCSFCGTRQPYIKHNNQCGALKLVELIRVVLECAEIVLDFGIGKVKVDQSGRLKKERMVEFDEITGEPVLVGGDAMVPKSDTDNYLDELSSSNTSLMTTSRTSSDPFGMKKDEEFSLDTMNSDNEASTAAIDAQLPVCPGGCCRSSAATWSPFMAGFNMR